jgi:hypothetical protein
MYYCSRHFEIAEAKASEETQLDIPSVENPVFNENGPIESLRQSYDAVLQDSLITGGTSRSLGNVHADLYFG